MAIRRTVLQQGDRLGSTGETGSVGPVGATGADATPRNMLVIEGIFTWQSGTPYYTLVKTYIIEEGETDFWVASVGHVWTLDGSDAIITITNILQDDTKKFDVFVQKEKFSYAGDVLPLATQGARIYIEIANVSSASNGTIELRMPISQNNSPWSWLGLGSTYNSGEFKFSLMILGEAS